METRRVCGIGRGSGLRSDSGDSGGGSGGGGDAIKNVVETKLAAMAEVAMRFGLVAEMVATVEEVAVAVAATITKTGMVTAVVMGGLVAMVVP